MLFRSDDYGQTFMNQESKLRAGFRLDPNIYRFSSDNRLVSSVLMHTYNDDTHC